MYIYICVCVCMYVNANDFYYFRCTFELGNCFATSLNYYLPYIL